MTYCIRNAAFFDFRWTYTMRTLHDSECSSSLRQSLISSHLNHMMTHTIFISDLIHFIADSWFLLTHDWVAKVFHAHEVFFLWILAKSHSYAVALFLISLQHYYKKMHPFCYHYYLQTSGTPSRVYKLLVPVPVSTSSTSQYQYQLQVHQKDQSSYNFRARCNFKRQFYSKACMTMEIDNDEGLCSG
jgi:hypothetical protein